MNRDNYAKLDTNFKWLGIIDYKVLLVIMIVLFLVWSLSSIFLVSIVYRLYTVIIVAIPLIGLFYSNRNAENVAEVIYIVLKYVFSPKIYTYKIESNICLLK